MIVSRPVVVLGMHRSGTSALAGLLSLSGVDFGDRLIPADPDVNAKGFWEHEEMVAQHDRAFAVLGMSWQDPRPMPAGWEDAPALQPIRAALAELVRRDFGHVRAWGLKDPRLCRLLPLWGPVFEELGVAPRVAMILRHPIEVAASLQRRDRIGTGRALLLWLRHVGEATEHAARFPCAILTYDQLLRGWQGCLDRIARDLDLSIAGNADGLTARAAQLIEPRLRHHVAGADTAVSTHPLLPLAESFYAATDSRTAIETARKQSARALETLSAAVIPWSAEVEHLTAEVERLRARESQLSAEIERVKSTFSWRLTGPFRALRNTLFGRKQENR